MKKGIVFFPVECTQSAAEQVLEAEFGCLSTAVLIALYRRIYSENGYYCEWNERISRVFAHSLHIEQETLDAIVNTALELALFDMGCYAEFGILTSKAVQEHYFYAVARRKKLDFNREYLLLDEEDLPKHFREPMQTENTSEAQKVHPNEENADKNAKNADRNEQTIQDNTRQDKTIQDNTRQDETKQDDAAPAQASGAAAPPQSHKISLSQEEYESLCTQYGRQQVDEYIDRMERYQQKTGKRYQDHARRLSEWMQKDGVGAWSGTSSGASFTDASSHGSSYDLEELQFLKNRF